MKRILTLLVLFSTILFAKSELLLDSANAFAITMRNNPNTSALINNSKAIIIFPSVKKVGFFIGGMYGEGVAAYKNGSDWSIYGAEISNASLGIQIGYEDNYLVLFIMSDKIINNMRKSKITLGADATILAGNASANVGSIDVLTKDVYAYTNKSGIFAGASLGGVVLSTKNTVEYKKETYGYKNLLDIFAKGR